MPPRLCAPFCAQVWADRVVFTDASRGPSQRPCRRRSLGLEIKLSPLWDLAEPRVVQCVLLLVTPGRA
eukprot:2178762-Lingulodinium_polyedra.AAC.1